MGFLLGFLPWILYWALVGNVDFRFAVCSALAVVIGTQLISRIGESWPSLDRSHLQMEKLDMLRHTVLNSALPTAPDEDVQRLLFTLIDELTLPTCICSPC